MDRLNNVDAANDLQDDHSLARRVVEYQFLRRQLIEMHATAPDNAAAIDALMRKLDETRSTLHAVEPHRPATLRGLGLAGSRDA